MGCSWRPANAPFYRLPGNWRHSQNTTHSSSSSNNIVPGSLAAPINLQLHSDESLPAMTYWKPHITFSQKRSIFTSATTPERAEAAIRNWKMAVPFRSHSASFNLTFTHITGRQRKLEVIVSTGLATKKGLFLDGFVSTKERWLTSWKLPLISSRSNKGSINSLSSCCTWILRRTTNWLGVWLAMALQWQHHNRILVPRSPRARHCYTDLFFITCGSSCQLQSSSGLGISSCIALLPRRPASHPKNSSLVSDAYFLHILFGGGLSPYCPSAYVTWHVPKLRSIAYNT